MNNDRLKFRLWDIKNEEYVEDQCDECCIYFDGRLHAGAYCDDGYTGHWDEYEQHEVIIEQCTGLRDKNGNLIYEGDILNAMCFAPDCEWHGCQVKVIWDKTAFQFLIFGERPYQILPFDQVMYNAENDGFEIIGNIHEQKEQQ